MLTAFITCDYWLVSSMIKPNKKLENMSHAVIQALDLLTYKT